MKKLFGLMIVLATGLVIGLTGCDTGSSGGGSGSGLTTTPVETISWVNTSDGKYTQYSTNDTANCGYLIYNWLTTTISADTEMSGAIKIDSGYSYNTNGFLCFLQDKDNFYAVFIHTHGRYSVQKKIAGSWSTVIGWTGSASLNQGYGVENIIDIKPTGSNVYDLYLNGSKVDSFTKAESPYNGKRGACAGTGTETEEAFPDTPVDVKFRFILPSAYP